MGKSVLAIRHVAFEDLAAFEAPLEEAGYAIRYCDIGLDDPGQGESADILAVLGAPIGACEEALYPFLEQELALIAARLRAGRPMLGICLGAQLMARALGSKVYPGRAKEIGWKKLSLTPAGEKHLGPLRDMPVLHWHGDTFDLPDGAENLAATPDCDQQAFRYGGHGLAFQFHPEAQEKGFERWLIGHAAEIAATPGTGVPQLRADTARYAPAAAAAGQAVLRNWLACL